MHSSRKELTSRAAEFEDAGLRVELDPIHRSGNPASYTSYLEATIRYPDDDVHDILFFYITLEGRFWTPVVQLKEGIVEAVDALLMGRS